MLVAFIICFFVGLLCILMGLLIWKKKQLSLIAGYKDESFKGDKKKLAKIVGIYTIVIGLLTMLFPFGLEYMGELTGLLFVVIVTVSTIVLVIYINKLNKHPDSK